MAFDPRWKRLLDAARAWRTTLIPNTSTGLAAESLREAVDAFPLVHTIDADGHDHFEPAITPQGRILCDADFEAMADEAEAGWLLEQATGLRWADDEIDAGPPAHEAL